MPRVLIIVWHRCMAVWMVGIMEDAVSSIDVRDRPVDAPLPQPNCTRSSPANFCMCLHNTIELFAASGSESSTFISSQANLTFAPGSLYVYIGAVYSLVVILTPPLCFLHLPHKCLVFYHFHFLLAFVAELIWAILLHHQNVWMSECLALKRKGKKIFERSCAMCLWSPSYQK